MKCMPMTCAGRETAAASLVIEMDDVLDARIASFFFICASASREDLELELDVLGGRLDDVVAVGERRGTAHRLDAIEQFGARPSDILPLATCLSSMAPILSLARVARSTLTSESSVR